ncbi:radical SAM protein [bacterium]|nr:radical SAM protein [bacterium]
MIMQTLPLQTGMVYGPVGSRRIGLSLGVNLSPITRKICSFNCVYCHYGWTDTLTMDADSENLHFPDVNDLMRQLETYQVDHHLLDHITFSGNGEATMHPNFDQAVEVVTEFRDKAAPQAKTAILSNSTMAHKPDVRKALLKLERRFMKLDAGDEKTFRQINRPSKAVDFNALIDGLKALGNFETQTIFLDGNVSNASDEAVDAWINVLSHLRPNAAQIYTLVRPPADSHLKPISRDRLKEIAERGKAADLRMQIF